MRSRSFWSSACCFCRWCCCRWGSRPAGTWPTSPRRRSSARRPAGPRHRCAQLPAGPLRGRRQPRQLPRRRRAEGRPARALLVRHQERVRARAAGRLVAAADRLGVRRPLQSPRRRHGRATFDQGRRCGSGARVLSRRHVPRAARDSASFTPARSPSRRAWSCRSCRSRSGARATSCRAAGSCRGPGRIDIQVLPALGPLTGPRAGGRDCANARSGAGAHSRRAGRAGSVGNRRRCGTAGAAALT